MKMIIVDDERIGREGLIDFIDWRKDYGIEIVGVASNGEEGFNLYQSKKPDIILTDIKMPIMTGIEMAEKIRTIDLDVRIILLSAYSDFSYAQKALKTKVDDYLLKPIEEEEVRRLMNQIRVESMERCLKKDSRRQFLNLMNGSYEWNHQLQQCTFQVFILGEPTERDRWKDSLWLLEFHEGSYVGIAKFSQNSSDYNSKLSTLRRGLYVGGLAANPQDIHRSYNEAVLAQYIGEFWSIKGVDYTLILKRREQWSKHQMEIQKEIIKLADEIRAALSQSEHEMMETIVHRTMQYLMQNQGIDPSYIEDSLMSLAIRVSQALSNFNDVKASLWELRISLHGSKCFHEIKGVFLNWLQNWIEKVGEQRKASDTTIIEQVVGIIEQQYAEDLNLRIIAERLYLSPNYLGNVFKNTTGMYFNDYLAMHRLKKATEFLITGSDKVTVISEAVGIPNTSYFSALFKKTYGLTPKEYRRLRSAQ
ncbi:response regulator [Paenibacillus sp. FSL R5-0517]|uniref:response regulator transcription factor n=1 Tax=Paenibacillus sp. FSL R5-0517 TaxID=2921647 RepID=UPI0030DB5B1E